MVRGFGFLSLECGLTFPVSRLTLSTLALLVDVRLLLIMLTKPYILKPKPYTLHPINPEP